MEHLDPDESEILYEEEKAVLIMDLSQDGLSLRWIWTRSLYLLF